MPDFGIASIPAAMSIGSGLLGAGSSLYGMMQGSPGQQLAQNPPPNFATGPQGTALMDWINQGSSRLPGQNLGGTVLPLGQQTAMNLYNNPGAQGLLQGAQTAGNVGMGVAGNNLGAGGALTGAGMNLLPYAQNILGTGFDPQQALYNRTLQQLQDQVRTGAAARGVNTSPYGAGLENQALSNFNIDWQNNLLGRQLQALGGAGGAVGQGGNAILGGQGLQSQVPGQIMGAAGLPFGAQQQVGQGQFGGLQGLLGLGGGAQALAQQPIQNYLAALAAGTAGSSVGNAIYGNQITAANQGFNQNQALGQGFGRGLAQMGQGMQGWMGAQQPGMGWSTMPYGGQQWPMAV